MVIYCYLGQSWKRSQAKIHLMVEFSKIPKFTPFKMQSIFESKVSQDFCATDK